MDKDTSREESDSNGESTFEIVDKKTGEAHATFPSGQPATVPMSAAPVSFPPPPLPNPYSIRAGAGPAATGSAQQPPTQPLHQPAATAPVLMHSAAAAPAVIPIPTAGHTVGFTPAGAANASQGYEMDAVPLSSPREESKSDSGVWGWFQHSVPGGEFLGRIAESAKHQVDSVITTLDPQMKDFLHTSGSIELVVASDKEAKITGIREGFQRVYSSAAIRGLGSPSLGAQLPDQPVGFEAGLRGADTRIQNLRQSGLIQAHIPVAAVEGFLAEISPDNWHEMAVVLLDDPNRSVKLHVFTQTVPVPSDAVNKLKTNTPAGYNLPGFCTTIGQAMAELHNCGPSEWHWKAAGRHRSTIIADAAAVLAFTYRRAAGHSHGHVPS